MKTFILWLAKVSGVYDGIYYAGWKAAGSQMQSHSIWWNQSKLPYRHSIQNAFEIYSRSLSMGCRPNMMRVRDEVDYIGNIPNPYPETPVEQPVDIYRRF